MKFKNKIRKGIHTTYEDQQSLAETHDMLVTAGPGQSYIKEDLHKVSTTQVTGDALMKVAVGGKGGFAAGTAGDVREQASVLNADVVRMEKKAIFKQRLEVAEALGITDGAKVEKRTIYCPSRIFGEKKVKGEIELCKVIGRDYDDFTYQNKLDASDYMKNAEFYKTPGLDLLREAYDEICGYRGAWKYVGLNGAEHRRYRIFIENTLDLTDKEVSTGRYNAPGNFWTQASRSNHHSQLHKAVNDSYIHNDESILDDWMKTHTTDHSYFIMWWLGQKDEFNPDTWKAWDQKIYVKPEKPSKKFLKLKAISEEIERKRRLESLKSDHMKEITKDWKVVYNWELTAKGKYKFK